ncbi:hypothetical protein CS238_26655 [Salmonella enterica]|nr:hypothetical protein [Salmonella enterica]EJC8750140.1 hypothetical protein [Salmonella enterica]HCM1652859.1 hypothetical protein [Salmonella enterica subsp. diarizonae serovar 48:i:z35]
MAGTPLIFRCLPHLKMPGKYILAVVLLVVLACRQLHGVPGINSGSFSFDVPDGVSFSVISNKMMACGCDFGRFTLLRYQ